MKRTSLGIIIASLACGAGATFMSCDNSSTSPGNPASRYDNGKGVAPLGDADCLNIYTGVENCPLGEATFTSAGQTITVSNLGDLADGISGSFADAAAWSQDMSADFGGGTGTLRYSASSEGEIIGQLNITHGTDGNLSAVARYTGEEGGPSAYSVSVLNNGVLVGSQTGISGDGGGPTIINGFVSHAGFGNVSNDGPYLPLVPRPVAPQPTDPDPWPWEDGACEWTLASTALLTVTLPNGTILSGNEVAFTEQVTPGHTVYSHFQRVDVQGHMGSYTVTGESSVPVED